MSVLNLTPHDIAYYEGSDPKIIYKKSGIVLRLVSNERDEGTAVIGKDTVKTVRHQSFIGLEVTGRDKIPAFSLSNTTGTVIVSWVVYDYLMKERRDNVDHLMLVYPDTSPKYVVRDMTGNIIGTRAFCTSK